MPVVTICSDFRTEEGEICQYFHLPSPFICHEVMGPDAWSWFFIFSFKLTFSLSFTLIKRLFSSSLLSVIRVVSFAYLRLLMLLSPILIPAYNSSSPAFLMMCLAYRSNRVTADSLVVLLSQSFLLLFLIFLYFILFFNFTILYWFCHISTTSSSIQRSICCFLTHIYVSQETGKMVWYSHLLKRFPQFVMNYIIKGFGAADKTEVDFFFFNSLAFSMIQQMLAIWSLVPLSFLNLAWSSGSPCFA